MSVSDGSGDTEERRANAITIAVRALERITNDWDHTGPFTPVCPHCIANGALAAIAVSAVGGASAEGASLNDIDPRLAAAHLAGVLGLVNDVATEALADEEHSRTYAVLEKVRDLAAGTAQAGEQSVG